MLHYHYHDQRCILILYLVKVELIKNFYVLFSSLKYTNAQAWGVHMQQDNIIRIQKKKSVFRLKCNM